MQLFYLHIYIHVGQSSNFPLSASMASDVDCGIACESKAADDEADFFECNICFELAKDPIVTLCGHLYCWPCLYQWLRVHSYSQECPVCKALVEEDKLVPIYGRGKGNHHDPRSRVLPESVSIPNRPVGQRPPRTAPRVDTRRNELNPMGASGRRFENLTMSALFGIVPDIFGLQANGGNVTGVPYMYPTSFHGGFVHGFYHHPSPVEEKHRLLKMLFLMLGVLVILCLICH